MRHQLARHTTVMLVLSIVFAGSADRDVTAQSIDLEIESIVLEGHNDVGSAVRPKPWNSFQIFVWQHQTDAFRDFDRYRSVGLQAFHIDRGAGKESTVRWASDHSMPYYVDHAAGKGILHLTEQTGLTTLRDDGSLQSRPRSLISSESISQLLGQLEANVPVVCLGPACAIALDDEISLANFNSPIEVDGSLESVSLYRKWLESKHKDIETLNQQWDTHFTEFSQVEPATFESVRQPIDGQPFARWNLSPWMNWRSYMDDQFAATITRLVKHASELAPNIPIGIVGGQQPSPYGGYDYSKIESAVQWIESYDIGGTNELLTSIWNDSRKPIVQTFFSSGEKKRDQWFLWYYLAHGNSAVIAWPEINGKPWFGTDSIHPAIKELKETFVEIQSPPFSFLSDPASRLVQDPIAIVYSHSSVQASWALDALVHGKTWPRRSSSLDNDCSSAGMNRIAWNKLLEDLGIQCQWITTDQLDQGVLEQRKFKAVILPRAIAIGETTCRAVERFVEDGGLVVADYLTAILDEHGKARVNEAGKLHGGLDDLFGIVRDESAGYFDGHSTTEMNGELYMKPFLDRLPINSQISNTFKVVERGTTRSSGHQETGEAMIHIQKANGGESVYLNSSPVAYCDNGYRMSSDGERWRATLAKLLTERVRPQAKVLRQRKAIAMAEVLHWQRHGEDYLVVIGNPSRLANVSGPGQMDFPIDAGPVTLDVAFRFDRASDVRTGAVFDASDTITFDWQPEVATVIRVEGFRRDLD